MKMYDINDLLPVVAKLTEKYTSLDSSSITYETANKLMDAVVYCIEMCSIDNKLMSADNLKPEDMYKAGYDLVIEKVKQVKDKYNEMITYFDAYRNQNYYDTVTKALPGFFRYYDPKFNPQNNVITMDYPTLVPVNDVQGILAIEKYIDYISLEQQFLCKLPSDYIENILEKSNDDYTTYFFNISNIILRHVVGKLLIGNSSDYNKLISVINNYTNEELRDLLESILHILIKENYDNNSKLENYLKYDFKDFVVELRNASKYNNLEQVVVL